MKWTRFDGYFREWHVGMTSHSCHDMATAKQIPILSKKETWILQLYGINLKTCARFPTRIGEGTTHVSIRLGLWEGRGVGFHP